jgi:hypothetical protein
MKPMTTALLRRFGFRATLLASGTVSAVFVAMHGLFAFGLPAALMILILFLSGLARSLQFSAIMTMGFADVAAERMSAATSLSGVFQQVSLALGVVVGTLLTEASTALRPGGGGLLLPTDFILPFLVLALLCVGSSAAFRELPADAGHEVSGHGRREAQVE